MLRLRSSVPDHRADEFTDLLRRLDGVYRVARQDDHSKRNRSGAPL